MRPSILSGAYHTYCCHNFRYAFQDRVCGSQKQAILWQTSATALERQQPTKKKKKEKTTKKRKKAKNSRTLFIQAKSSSYIIHSMAGQRATARKPQHPNSKKKTENHQPCPKYPPPKRSQSDLITTTHPRSNSSGKSRDRHLARQRRRPTSRRPSTP